jgi:hypothetical protein
MEPGFKMVKVAKKERRKEDIGKQKKTLILMMKLLS